MLKRISASDVVHITPTSRAHPPPPSYPSDAPIYVYDYSASASERRLGFGVTGATIDFRQTLKAADKEAKEDVSLSEGLTRWSLTGAVGCFLRYRMSFTSPLCACPTGLLAPLNVISSHFMLGTRRLLRLKNGE